MPELFEHLGPYRAEASVQAFCAISERCFEAYRVSSGGDTRTREPPKEHLGTRMMYISETTSAAIRLIVSWGLSMPGMSLLRDRYEQVVRFSWLARQTEDSEFPKYLASSYSKMNSLYQNLSSVQQTKFQQIMGDLPEWVIQKPSKEQSIYLRQWESPDLQSMANKRDGLRPLWPGELGKQPLAGLYTSIYRQFSSVAHFDMYSVSMLSFYKAKNEDVVLAPNPWWPSILSLHNSLFDLIQCAEALIGFHGCSELDQFDHLFREWRSAGEPFL